MNEFEYNNQLLDFYAPLLTVKQQEIMELYYRENYSLQEIAELKAVSRSAVYDSIQRSIKILLDYESKLKLIAKFELRNQLYQELALNSENQIIIEKLKNID